MAREPQGVPASDDALLIRAFARGETSALGPLLDRHLPLVYGLLRMTLPTGAEAEAALSDAFCTAASRADEPLARTDPERWLAGIAIEQVERRARPSPPVSLEERRRLKEPSGPEARRPTGADDAAIPDEESIAGVSDSALAVLIRTLDLHRRQALVLGVVCGLEDARVAAVIGCEPWEVERLKARAIEGLGQKLIEHERREAELKRQIEAVPYKLRPVPVSDAYGTGRGPAGNTTVVGHRVHLEPARDLNIFNLLRRAVKRLAELFRRHRLDVDLDDDSGETGGERSSPEPTPSLQPFEKPPSTPTTRGYRTPKLSPGVAVYAMPRKTPTTRRLSNPRRPSRPGGR